jgi:predicted DNA-binding ribbon-helix-helix protein
MRTKDLRGKSLIAIRNVRLGKHKVSVCLEEPFWVAIKEIAAAQGSSMAQLISKVDSERRERDHKNLASATRLFILDYYRSRCGPEQPSDAQGSIAHSAATGPLSMIKPG